MFKTNIVNIMVFCWFLKISDIVFYRNTSFLKIIKGNSLQISKISEWKVLGPSLKYSNPFVFT